MQNYKYISQIPKPFLDDLVQNNVVPFVGAGFSKNADIKNNATMPDWNEIGKLASSEIEGYTYENNAIDALSYYESSFSRAKLIEMLMRELNTGNVSPGKTHKAFCDLFTDTVCTTNFDFLLEDTFKSLKRPLSVIVSEDRLTISFNNETKLIKLHGDFNHPDGMVVTETDYDLFISNNPIMATYVSNLFITKTMFLIGYSLDDMDFRSLWQLINSRIGKMTRPAYCISVNASQDKIARYNRRNIRVINIIDEERDYRDILTDVFVELKRYLNGEREKVTVSTDERINEQLVIPTDYNRLCFISAPMSRISQLKRLLYPTLEELRITPVRADDIIMPGDNWMDKAEMAIGNSNIAIVDITDNNPNVMYELGLITSSSQSKYILIAEDNKTKLSDYYKHDVLYYSFDIINNKDLNNEFYKNLRRKCNQFYKYHKNKIMLEDAHRLFDKAEYSAAIVSALTDLELVLNRNSQRKSRKSIKELFNTFDAETQNKLTYCMQIRNEIVHTKYDASLNEAKIVIHEVERILDQKNINK